MMLPFFLPCSFSSLKHPSTPYSSTGMFWFCHCIAVPEKPRESHSGQLDLACGPPVLWAATHTLPSTSFSTSPPIPLQLSLKCNHQMLDPALGAWGPRMTLEVVAASVDLVMCCASWVPAPRSHLAGCLALACPVRPPSWHWLGFQQPPILPLHLLSKKATSTLA